MSLPRRWLFVPIGLLVINALVMAVLVIASSSHPPAVVPRYYERAVTWDQSVAEAQLASDLGWKVDLELATMGAVVRARDGQGLPVAGAHVRISGFHRSQPRRAMEVEMTTDAGGDARAIPHDGAQAWLATPGWYEIDVAVKRGAISYSTHRSVELAATLVDAHEGRGL
jgi:nitrogen fixation protein FixH